MKRFFVNIVSGLILLIPFIALGVGSVWIANTIWPAAQQTTETAPTIATPAVTITEPPVQIIKRYKTVEDYFSAKNPTPLSYRFGEPHFVRDVTWSRRNAIIERDCGRCLVCGSSTLLEVDHGIALMNGGDNSDGNLGTLCDECHNEKTRYDWSIKRKRRKMLEKAAK